MYEDKIVNVTIGGKSFDLYMSTAATKVILDKCGSLQDFGEELEKANDMGSILTTYPWLIVLLANEGTRLHNFEHPDDQRMTLTEELIDLLTTPAEVFELSGAAVAAFRNGLHRNIESEDDSKNAEVG